MKRLAIFVEGKTERVFIEKFLGEIAQRNSLAIRSLEIRGGANSPRTVSEVTAAHVNAHTEYYILIVDCGGESQVASRIREEHVELTNKGYEKIIGIRDLRPSFTLAELPKLMRGLRYGISTKLAPVEFIVSIAETEAWFLAEFTHFERIDKSLTLAVAQAALNFCPQNDNVETRLVPSDDLDVIYKLAGHEYTKKGGAVKTVEALDYAEIYISVSQRVPPLNSLLVSLDAFLT